MVKVLLKEDMESSEPGWYVLARHGCWRGQLTYEAPRSRSARPNDKPEGFGTEKHESRARGRNQGIESMTLATSLDLCHMPPQCRRSSVVEHRFGKAEVGSSILLDGTISWRKP